MELNVLEELHLPVAAFIMKYEGDEKILVDMNSALIKLTGYKRKDLVGAKPTDFCNEKDYEVLEKELKRLVEHKTSRFQVELRIIKSNGSEEWVLLLASIYGYLNGSHYVIYTMSTIQTQKETERQRNLLMKRYEMMRIAAGEIPFDLDLSNWSVLVQNLSANESTRKNTYIPFNHYLKLIHPMDRNGYQAWVSKASQRSMSGVFEYRYNVAPEGSASNYRWFRLHYRSVADEGKMLRIIGQSQNIDEDIFAREEAKRDSLTKLLNKGETARAMRQTIAEKPRGHFVLMVIDIDNFKSINDTFGHTYGDTVIVDNANIIQNVLPNDAIIGRVGGDEFVALLPGCTMVRAESKASMLCKSLAKSYSGDGVSLHISASIGLSEYGVNGKSYEELFTFADSAMYRSKRNGKNQYSIANPEDLKPGKTRRKKMEARYKIQDQDAQQFLMFAVELMSHARNIDGSLNMLLKKTASQFGFDHILLFEDGKEKNHMILTNYYSNNLSFYERMLIQVDGERLQKIQPDTVIIVDSDEISPENVIVETFHQSQLKVPDYFSLAASKFDFLAEKSGLVLFISENPDFFWTDDISGVLQELIRILSVFVSLRYRMDESKAEIRRIQQRDNLTGLYNFEPFKSKVISTMNEADEDEVFLLEYMDINNFGYINENYGYKIGDDILKRFASDIQDLPSYCLGCRIYSDFFTILYRGKNIEQLTEEIKRQHTRFSNMQNYQYPNSGIGICSGICEVDREQNTIDAVFENITLAWKQVKSTPKTSMCMFYPELKQKKLKEQQIVGEFYESLYRDDFKLYLQPKYNMKTREIYGAESLARWRKPNGEVIMPSVFLEPLEKIGFITELDFYMFEELLKTLTRWKKNGNQLIVCSTNFSGRHFERGGNEFINRMRTIMNKYQIDPKYIELEITEGVLISNREEVTEILQRLRDVGFRISIDDFGTGYSSLSILSDIPADSVKMDKSFMRLSETENGRKMLTEFNRLFEITGKEVIFEGVESEKQEQILMECGYSLAQGFLLSKPIPVHEFEQLYLK